MSLAHFGVDRKRVHLIGHSNGAFMCYRMACQSADLIAGIAPLAGMTFLEPAGCHPSEPVNILHIQGSTDNYYGGAADTSWAAANMPLAPGAVQAIQIWASYNGASGLIADPAPSMDLDKALPDWDPYGFDTVVTRYTNCPPGGAVELWTIIGAGHIPKFSTNFSPNVIDWLLAHPKP